ncbi:dihydropteroate synthase [Algoriphagus marincola]|uniref:dihydropteroate synthase n=1 Tax=Algoriphagus marincola TaxID=264027 RepID=A0ABS7N1D8_9BACT|nr:dihydropteroate synthase [Algoriphagus marincola]MBY5949733.1 dihydropteroate synthase [Algoriphagus marincola]
MSLISFPSTIEDKLFPQKITLQIKGRLILWDEPQIMGVMNLTPDSFYEGSRLKLNKDDVLGRAQQMINDGADILDIGGYSSRPGAANISIEEEIQRIEDPIQWISEEFPEIIISVDTFRSEVARRGIEAGAHMVNDISGGSLDPNMYKTISELSVPYIIMHMQGTPQNMQGKTHYENILREILNYFSEKLHIIREFGIKDVIIDPGFGFAKTLEQNYFLLKNLELFDMINLPILVGLSRKSMIYKLLEVEPSEALNGTTALNMVALMKGANILRVHDVKEANETRKLFKQLYA